VIVESVASGSPDLRNTPPAGSALSANSPDEEGMLSDPHRNQTAASRRAVPGPVRADAGPTVVRPSVRWGRGSRDRFGGTPLRGWNGEGSGVAFPHLVTQRCSQVCCGTSAAGSPFLIVTVLGVVIKTW